MHASISPSVPSLRWKKSNNNNKGRQKKDRSVKDPRSSSRGDEDQVGEDCFKKKTKKKRGVQLRGGVDAEHICSRKNMDVGQKGFVCLFCLLLAGLGVGLCVDGSMREYLRGPMRGQ